MSATANVRQMRLL